MRLLRKRSTHCFLISALVIEMFVADTHAWVYYLLDRLPQKADEIFKSVENFEDVMLVPAIALSECVHLVETNRIKVDYRDIFSRFEGANNFVVVPLDLEIVKMLPSIKLSELHDRIIVATASSLNAVLITKDREIAKSGLVKTVWE